MSVFKDVLVKGFSGPMWLMSKLKVAVSIRDPEKWKMLSSPRSLNPQSDIKLPRVYDKKKETYLCFLMVIEPAEHNYRDDVKSPLG